MSGLFACALTFEIKRKLFVGVIEIELKARIRQHA